MHFAHHFNKLVCYFSLPISSLKVITAHLVDGNEVMGMKCCNGNSNEGMDMRIGNEDSFVWCAWLKNGNGR